jgi:hypothetical protein
MTDQNVTAQVVGACRHKFLAKGMCSGSTINNDQCPSR